MSTEAANTEKVVEEVVKEVVEEEVPEVGAQQETRTVYRIVPLHIPDDNFVYATPLNGANGNNSDPIYYLNQGAGSSMSGTLRITERVIDAEDNNVTSSQNTTDDDKIDNGGEQQDEMYADNIGILFYFINKSVHTIFSKVTSLISLLVYNTPRIFFFIFPTTCNFTIISGIFLIFRS